MPIIPEFEPKRTVTEAPDVPEISPAVERATGVKVIPTQPATQTNKVIPGQPSMYVPATSSVTIQLPSPQQHLVVWSKGSVDSSLTWWSSFWMRMVKKAIHFGWNIITKGVGAKASN